MAPSLPPVGQTLNPQQISQAEHGATCESLERQRKILVAKMAEWEGQIRAKREQNQATVYVASVLFPPAALLADNDDTVKGQLDKAQTRIDEILALKKLKRCPSV